jgi:lipopolysaccharide-induced tumor necrosis factor-alpha factor
MPNAGQQPGTEYELMRHQQIYPPQPYQNQHMDVTRVPLNGYVSVIQMPNILPVARCTQVPNSIMVKCPGCGFIGSTVIDHQAGKKAWVCCFIMTFTTGFCFLPFCIDSCKDKMHICANCHGDLGVFEVDVCWCYRYSLRMLKKWFAAAFVYIFTLKVYWQNKCVCMCVCPSVHISICSSVCLPVFSDVRVRVCPFMHMSCDHLLRFHCLNPKI